MMIFPSAAPLLWGNAMDDLDGPLLEFGCNAGELPSRETYSGIAAATLLSAIPGDVVVSVTVDMAAGPQTKTWFSSTVPDFVESMHEAVVSDFPLVRYYFAYPADTAPRRISDCVSDRQWRSSRAYSEFFKRTGAHYQLGIPTVHQRDRGCGWGINRTNRDFTAADIKRAAELQPTLALLDHIYAADASRGSNREHGEISQQCPGLTPRERQIIRLLADGLTVKQIAMRIGIAPRTVGTHLDNASGKLGRGGLVRVINRARDLGLV